MGYLTSGFQNTQELWEMLRRLSCSYILHKRHVVCSRESLKPKKNGGNKKKNESEKWRLASTRSGGRRSGEAKGGSAVAEKEWHDVATWTSSVQHPAANLHSQPAASFGWVTRLPCYFYLFFFLFLLPSFFLSFFLWFFLSGKKSCHTKQWVANNNMGMTQENHLRRWQVVQLEVANLVLQPIAFHCYGPVIRQSLTKSMGISSRIHDRKGRKWKKPLLKNPIL